MKNRDHDAAMVAVGQQIEAVKAEEVKEQLEGFRTTLTDFAKKHRGKINDDPEFRNAFCEMCTAVGVDPLVSSKGMWAELLGVGQFYSELAVQVLTVCLATRDVNGGLLVMNECLQMLNTGQRESIIDARDVERAIGRLKALGRGVSVRTLADRRQIIVSVPDELNTDQAAALDVAAKTKGCISASLLKEQLGWAAERSDKVLSFFVREGLCWVDAQGEGGSKAMLYWFPSLAFPTDAQA